MCNKISMVKRYPCFSGDSPCSWWPVRGWGWLLVAGGQRLGLAPGGFWWLLVAPGGQRLGWLLVAGGQRLRLAPDTSLFPKDILIDLVMAKGSSFLINIHFGTVGN